MMGARAPHSQDEKNLAPYKIYWSTTGFVNWGSETYYFNRLLKFLGFPQILEKYKPCSGHCTFGRWRARDNVPE